MLPSKHKTYSKYLQYIYSHRNSNESFFLGVVTLGQLNLTHDCFKRVLHLLNMFCIEESRIENKLMVEKWSIVERLSKVSFQKLLHGFCYNFTCTLVGLSISYFYIINVHKILLHYFISPKEIHQLNPLSFGWPLSSIKVVFISTSSLACVGASPPLWINQNKV